MLGSFDEVSLRSAMISLQNRYGQQLDIDSINQIEQRIENLIYNKDFQKILHGANVSKEHSLSFEGEDQNQVGYYKKAIANITGKRTEGMIIYLLNDTIEIVKI